MQDAESVFKTKPSEEAGEHLRQVQDDDQHDDQEDDQHDDVDE